MDRLITNYQLPITPLSQPQFLTNSPHGVQAEVYEFIQRDAGLLAFADFIAVNGGSKVFFFHSFFAFLLACCAAVSASFACVCFVCNAGLFVFAYSIIFSSSSCRSIGGIDDVYRDSLAYFCKVLATDQIVCVALAIASFVVHGSTASCVS